MFRDARSFPGLSKSNQDVILAAWARSLGVDVAEFYRANESLDPFSRLEVAGESRGEGWDPQTATFLQLFDVSLLYGPQWFLDSARQIPNEVLALESSMLEVGYEAHARSHGEEAIFYAEDIPIYDDAQLNITSTRRNAQRLARACPPDDTAVLSLESMDHYFTISTFENPAPPIAGAGYDVFSASIGHLAVLVAAAQRANGYGTFTLARVAEECMFDGLIPQWVLPLGDDIGEKMAADVGFVLSGLRTSVTFT
ncbi:hypothetical protein [Yaniella halotolerans]|uniref:hypothetical protein n=1 Tax=Yaniella halotolerans TaxID=225453 RepID=UPI0003B5940B|nr:hypothetical protein [Yaniella halotolerans]